MSDYAFPPEEWLDVVGEMAKDHVSMRAKKVPEGMLFVVHCSKCMGHHEKVAVRRPGDTPETVADGIAGELNAFAEEHAGCETEPKVHVIPRGVEELVELALEGSRQIVGRGETVEPMLALRMADPDHPVMLIPVPMVDDYGTQERTIGIAKLHYAVREHVRAHDLDVLGAAMWTEAWLARGKAGEDPDAVGRPADHPGREEVITILVMTPTHVRFGTAPITRASGVQDVGHGTLGEIQWADGGSFGGIMLEGVMAV